MKSNKHLTICIITKDAQENISQLLPTLDWADEKIIVDDYSTDNTREIAIAHGSRVYKRKLNDDYASQRNYALSKAKKGWVLFLDADERVSDDLKEEIIEKIDSTRKFGFAIKREDIFLGKHIKYGEIKNTHLVRLAKKGEGSWKRSVHEYWQVDSPGKLKNPLTHISHSTVLGFIEKINKYTSIEASYRIKNKVKVSLWQIIAYPIGKFIHTYVIKLGFLDGFHGFILSLVMSMHSFLVRAKTYAIYEK